MQQRETVVKKEKAAGMVNFEGTLGTDTGRVSCRGIVSAEYAAKLEPCGKCLNCGEDYSNGHSKHHCSEDCEAEDIAILNGLERLSDE